MVRVVSTINMKGGVGKTALTVALAEFLAEEWGKKVLVIDLDPQTNATVTLISQERWKQLDDAGKTLAQMFGDFVRGTSEFKIEEAIVSNVSNLHGGINGLDLLPSSLGLIDLEDQLPMATQLYDWTVTPIDILKTGVSGKIGTYDYVLIDCPPNLGRITQNGLRMSEWYMIPTIPDILSTLGIPQILKRVETHAARWKQKLAPLAIVLTKVRGVNLHRTMSGQLRARSASGEYPPVFVAEISEAAHTAQAMEFESQVNTLRQKYGSGIYFERYYALTEEFLKACP